ncbi:MULTISPECIES: hypothetical protein [unclassified Nostoc]|uniref:hypothetical protein n=1 Tax=unclassified Nostoc TaxID=2593658 RepID=UPI002AD37872|nr:hypothetical protein [Nostoc sp. DedQUE03]MDZ7974991.1 hypothetical protein [Nostoc sp. DedQUE03]MDZ8046626.1 hypothetical protein [Nostoc sp. DedQUE02]
MSIRERLNQNNRYFQEDLEDNSAWLPSSFAEVVARVKNFTLGEFDREVIQNQLYYHTREHLNNVQRRANAIFQVICPYWQASLGKEVSPEYITRINLLLELCAVAHDMIQIFVPEIQPHTSRRREPGVSENLTFEKLLNYIKGVNQQLKEHCLDDSILFTDADISMIQNAIQATICIYDLSDQGIYQPVLYEQNKDLSVVACIIALADIGSLGMDGIAAYNQEGSLLFLEENPDVIPVILNKITATSSVNDPQLDENIRQRLLKRARFQVSFAKSRLMRYPQEIANLPKEAIPILTCEVFQHLNFQTIQEIELTTPTDENTSLEELINFFKLEMVIGNEELGLEIGNGEWVTENDKWIMGDD